MNKIYLRQSRKSFMALIFSIIWFTALLILVIIYGVPNNIPEIFGAISFFSGGMLFLIMGLERGYFFYDDHMISDAIYYIIKPDFIKSSF